MRLHVFGHDGVGFVGRPGSAKDAVYKNAHAIIGFADAPDVSDLVAVLEPDIDRLKSQGQHRGCRSKNQAGVDLLTGLLTGGTPCC